MYATVPTVLPGSVSSARRRASLQVDAPSPAAADGFGEAEVEDLRPARGEENVRRLDVAMDDARAVRGIERVGQRDRDVDERAHVERSARQPLLQRLALRAAP